MPNSAKGDAIAVIAVNWNGGAMTLECLAALRASRGAAWHFVIVDNASSDDSLGLLHDLGDDVVLLKSPTNSGWSGGNNLGIKWALEAGYKWLFLLNNDAMVEPDTLSRLLEVARERPNAVLGPIHLDGIGACFDFVGTDVHPKTGLPLWKSVEPSAVEMLPDLIETSLVKGAGMFLRAAHLDQVGPFEESFFLNFDETDWCYRGRRAGLDLLMVKSARIRHLGSGTIGGSASPLQVYFLARNELLFAERHCTFGQRMRQLRHLYWAARDLPRGAVPRNTWLWGFLTRPSPAQRAFMKGALDYILRRFGECPPSIRALNYGR